MLRTCTRETCKVYYLCEEASGFTVLLVLEDRGTRMKPISSRLTTSATLKQTARKSSKTTSLLAISLTLIFKPSAITRIAHHKLRRGKKRQTNNQALMTHLFKTTRLLFRHFFLFFFYNVPV